jgi:plasmid replication initiation protein
MEDNYNNDGQLPLVFKKRPTNYQPNVFTESRQEFTELEKKIVTLVVNQIGHQALRGGTQLGGDMVFRVPFLELTKTNNHSKIADAAESLQSKRLIYRNDKTHQLDIITPFPRIRFDLIDGQRIIELTMFSAVVPHFAELGQRYTKYDIDVMLSLSSVYSQRMFEIVSMYHNRGQHQFTYVVSRLMEMLNCPAQYTFNDFRKNSLVIAQRELQQKANINLEWTPSRKEGKKIVELTFIIKSSQQLALEGVKQDRQAINQMSINEAVTTAWQLMKNYKLKSWQKELIVSDHSLLETFYRVDSELANGLRSNVKNPTAYLVKSLGIEHQKAPKQAPPTKAPIPAPLLPLNYEARSATTQSMASILGAMMMEESPKKTSK